MSEIDWQLTIDSADPHRQADFWAAALRYELEDHHDLVTRMLDSGVVQTSDTVRHHDRLAWRMGTGIRGAGRRILFVAVPEAKSVKNRVHMDLNVGRDQVPAEVQRLVELGATRVREVEEHGGYHVVMLDPEDNEFCVQ